MSFPSPKSFTPDLRTPAAREFWNAIASVEDPFSQHPTLKQRVDNHAISAWRDAFRSQGIELFEEGKEPFLPIEMFKWSPNLMPMGAAVRTFRSSGTTMRERSVSKFSHDGYELYRSVSLLTFYRVLKRFFATPETIQGFSLVPSVKEWPESSLAQMVEWIGGISPVTYLDANNLTLLEQQTTPVWVFGTGFHFVELFDQGKKFPLPPGSLVIETGGTKGKTREVTREEYLRILEEGFAVRPWQILSEYGMSELASQAYEWLEHCENHKARMMRFPWWVDVQATDAKGASHQEEFGALCLFDHARIDIPLPIRTQDLVTTRKNGSFALKGRVPVAALKGCSLNAEAITGVPFSTRPTSRAASYAPSLKPAVDRLNVATAKLQQFLQDAALHDLGVREFGNETLFEGFKNDLLTGLRDCRRDPESVLKRALGSQEKTYAQWLFILSATHPQAAFYPCVLGYALGLKMWLRPTKVGESLEGKFFRFLADLPGAEITLLSSSFRIGADKMPDVEAIFCFGSDETVKHLQEISGLPVAGYGSHLTVSQMDDFSPASLNLAAKDCLSLAQKGCMSTRLLVCKKNYSDTDADDFMAKLQETASPWVAYLSDTARDVSLDHEWTEARLRKKAQRVRLGLPLIYSFDEMKLSIPVQELFSQRSLVIPVLFVSPERITSFLQRLKRDITDFNLFTATRPEKIAGVETRPLGQANQPPWDGYLQGRPLFATNMTHLKGAL